MSRRHYLITYDIAHDKRRNKVFDTMQDHGNHTQYSVFLCELSEMEIAELRYTLTSLINPREDQVLIVDLGPGHHDLAGAIESIGQPFETTPRAFIV